MKTKFTLLPWQSSNLSNHIVWIKANISCGFSSTSKVRSTN